jgi:DNA-directed RNA polymerase subunit beta'
MLSTNNILNPKDGSPVVTPTQDMVLGCYYLTLEKEDAKGEGMIFSDTNEAIMAYESGVVEFACQSEGQDRRRGTRDYSR